MPNTYIHLEPVEVWDCQARKWRKTMIDAPFSEKTGKTWAGEYGWITVTGWGGCISPSVRVENVRKITTEK